MKTWTMPEMTELNVTLTADGTTNYIYEATNVPCTITRPDGSTYVKEDCVNDTNAKCAS